MKKTALTIAGGLGDSLVIRIFFDAVKHEYEEIRISHDRKIVDFWRKGDPKYYQFLDELGNLLFTEPPYAFDHFNHTVIHTVNTLTNLGTPPKTPNLSHLLCKGTSLNLGGEYIVLTTKIRGILKSVFTKLSPTLWEVLQKISQRYKIVVLGEREIEKNKEYDVSVNRSSIFCIYDQIIENIPNDRIIDLTIPALGVTVPTLKQIQQDCLIMKESKFVISIGIGGNLWMPLAVANTIGYRDDNDAVVNLIGNSQYDTAYIAKNWFQFIQKLKSLYTN
jgi:hypothetical protein